ncbi:hypothetical protein TSUD_284410 [Trifolium subterraneum]|uniref:Uncharacterized protein n=1 Tax=Trifolium subterraneum TaxID=3900 RepID=A0A2Z6NBG8_TRISU|nr:hypothetical protein TSUD_284410 [Trifolium subterraneum]
MGEIGLRCFHDIGERTDARFEDGTGDGTATGWRRTEVNRRVERSQGMVCGGATAADGLIVMLWIFDLFLGRTTREDRLCM